jgi:LeuA allosteric (dimerisation) domain
MTDATSTSTRSAATLHLARWTINSGSNTQSRGAVIVESGDHRWQASAEGNGPVDALFRAVDAALAEVLSGHPRLVAYDVHALAEGGDAEGRVTVKLAPPEGAAGERAHGTYAGVSTSTNIIAASVEAYIQALNELLAEEHWAGATHDAGNFRAAPTESGPRNQFDPSLGRLEPDLFDR